MTRRLPMICLVAALAAVAFPMRPALAQAPRPGDATGAPPVPARGHDKVWSTQPRSDPVQAPAPGGVVVMTPNVVLGWGGLPPGGPGPRPVPGMPGWGPPAGGPAMPLPGGPSMPVPGGPPMPLPGGPPMPAPAGPGAMPVPGPGGAGPVVLPGREHGRYRPLPPAPPAAGPGTLHTWRSP
jgi:hypothetical protein